MVTPITDATLPAGCYLIVDLCYPFSGQQWDEVCDLLQAKGDDRGIYELADGTRFGLLRTAHGDGEFSDNLGNSYGVDSGTLGCVRLQDLAPDVCQRFLSARSHYSRCCSVHTVPFPFRPTAEDGFLSFGPISINTDSWDEDCFEEEDWESCEEDA
jgi:hypothetical protein